MRHSKTLLSLMALQFCLAPAFAATPTRDELAEAAFSGSQVLDRLVEKVAQALRGAE